MNDESAYASLTESIEHDDPRWAFGTGFEDVEAEITAAVPDGVDAADLAAYCRMLGDDALVYSQRLSEWVANSPELEEDVALANIALDLLGQARALLSRAGHVEGAGRDEDALAYLRDTSEFRNVALVEQGDDLDFAVCVTRLLVFSTWRLALLQRLVASTDPVIAAVAGKGVKEVAYHRDFAARWTLRLGDGTDESHRRMVAALRRVWPHVEELFRTSEVERRLAGVAADPAATRAEFDAVVDEVLARATLERPDVPPVGTIGGRGGREGVHTEQLGHVLAEMQSLARAHPGGDMVSAQAVVAGVVDPEMPMLTLDDLGVIRSVDERGGRIVVTITPTYSGCPAVEEMRADIRAALGAAGHGDVEVRTVLAPAWSTDWITEAGRRKLAEAGIAPPGAAPRGPVPLLLAAPPVRCPRCGSPATEKLSRFGPTACTALRRCPACREPFEHMKEH